MPLAKYDDMVKVVPIVNPIRWRLIENRAMLLLDVRFVQTDLWDGDRSATVASNARGRDFGAEAESMYCGVPIPRERRASLEKTDVQADPTGISGKADMAG